MITGRTVSHSALVIGLVLGLFGCPADDPVGPGADVDAGFDADGGKPPLPGLSALRIDPTSASIVDDGQPPGQTVAFRALGTFAAGERDVSAEVNWQLEDQSLGSLVDGLFTSVGVGGMSEVRASSGNLSATADLSVRLEVIALAPGTPTDAPMLFPVDVASDMTGGDAPVIIYPSHETMFPRNVRGVLHQWRVGGNFDLYEVRFMSDVANVRYYTTELTFLLEGAAWDWIAATHAGRSLQMTVRAVSRATPAVIQRSTPITIHYSRSEVLGALYYWSTGAKGIMRATIEEQSATKFYTDPDSEEVCVSCHTVSRDGRRLASGFGGEKMQVITVPDKEVLVPTSAGEPERDYGWGTFNPGATKVLYAHKGRLSLVDIDTGTSSAVELPQDTWATHPDWSPDGQYVAVTHLASDREPKNKDITGSSIARMSVNADGSFGTPEVLVQSSTAAGDETLYFPSYSPDSRWLIYVRGVGKSKDNETSELYLVRADGSQPPLFVALLNRRVRNEDDVIDIGNSMPTWAPSTRPETNWIAFSSLRNYGDVLIGSDRDQLWGVAIDLERAAMGQDPSFAAFWMPFQNLDEGNHRAFWTLSEDDICPSTVEICDNLDNDCDGIVDEDCCTPAPEQMEICGDMLDNDCDGSVDEGCGCGTQEDCNNSIDDDCDGLIDFADEDCSI